MKHIVGLMAIVALISFGSCGDEVEAVLTETQQEAVSDQSLTEAYFNEAGDMSMTAFNSPDAADLSGGRTNGIITITVEGDTRFDGAEVTLETGAGSEPLTPIGTITIDFGAGQTDPRGTVRSGKILVSYQGLRFVPQSTAVITFENYKVNGVKIEGTRTVTSTSFTASPSLTVAFSVADVDGKATFEDGTTITRNASHTHTIVFGPSADKITWTVEGQATGKTRTDVEYVFAIGRPLVFRLDCALGGIALPAEGDALFTLGTTPITINYGEAGAGCDNKINVSVAGVSQEITVD